jgi:hypothetical protein
MVWGQQGKIRAGSTLSRADGRYGRMVSIDGDIPPRNALTLACSKREQKFD